MAKFRLFWGLAFLSLLLVVGYGSWEMGWASDRASSYTVELNRETTLTPNPSPIEGEGGKAGKNISSSLVEGRNLYNLGRFASAVQVWQQALKEFETQGDASNQALTLSYLSNAYQELGDWENARQTITASLEVVSKISNNQPILAQVLNTQGNLQLAKGETEAALNTWQLAAKTYAEIGDEIGVLGSQINQAQALQNLGQYRRAQMTLEQLEQKLKSQPDSTVKATGLRSLGIALQVVGDLTRSQQVLEQSLAIAQKLNSPNDISAAWFSLGNTARALRKPEALQFYQQAAETSTEARGKIEALVNQFSLLIETKQQTKAQALIPQIQTQLSNLSPSRDAIYASVNFARNWLQLGESHPQIAQLLAKAIQQSRQLQDPRAESYALGQLGELYQKTQQLDAAQNLTQQALLIAEKISADDILAGQQAQLGAILKQKGETQKAIAVYSEAVKTLKSLRSDLVAVNPNVQFSFRENVEPVYRELVGLLLADNPTQDNLKQARQAIESLQLAELENYFREACLNVKPQQIDQIDPESAVIYPIILPDRLAVILSRPGQPLRYYNNQIIQTEIEKTLSATLESLNPFFSDQQRLRLSQQVYDWLIRPAETELAQSQIKTLVFVLDGVLRNLPMAALHDGKSYLIEKYNIAVTPGLQLVEARSLAQQKIKVLTGGITEARQGFSALPGVKLEIEQIAAEVPTEIFLDQNFTENNLQQEVEKTSFPIVHLATHGQFSSNPEQTFILTWDGKVQAKEFEQLLQSREQNRPSPIELLVLSACQTATGDTRATLGLAGVAVRSGARSTIATLWSVKDRSTALLMTEFYRQLSQTTTKAEALRMAQLSLLKEPKYQHPFYWSPFILLGNWL